MEQYLSEVLDIDAVLTQYGNKIVIVSGVGSGKSTWVKDTLTKMGTVLFITSRRAKVEADIHNSQFSDYFNWDSYDKQILITNAKLATMVENIKATSRNTVDEFIDHFDYIVVDEVHSISTDSSFAEPSCTGVLSFIEYAVSKGKPVITMTGTLTPMKRYFENNQWAILDFTKKCRYVHPKKVKFINKNDVIKVIKNHWETNQVIYFANRTKTIVNLCKELIDDCEKSESEIAAIVAKSREKDFGTEMKISIDTAEKIQESSETVYNSIITKSVIPDSCRVMFSTSVLREGIDIENKDIVMICEDHILSNLIQFFGRARERASVVYIVQDAQSHTVSHNLLLCEYAAKKEVQGANEFLEESIAQLNEIDLVARKTEFIRYVLRSGTKYNTYIYFDYIMDRFKVFGIKVHEELRLKDILDNKTWKKDITDYCREYGIECPPIQDSSFDDMRKNVFTIMRNQETKFYVNSKEWEILLRMIKTVYGISYVQISKINRELKEKRAPFQLVAIKESKRACRDKTYWQVVSAEEL